MLISSIRSIELIDNSMHEHVNKTEQEQYAVEVFSRRNVYINLHTVNYQLPCCIQQTPVDRSVRLSDATAMFNGILANVRWEKATKNGTSTWNSFPIRQLSLMTYDNHKIAEFFFFCFVFYASGDCWGNRQKARAHDHIVCCYLIPYRSICVVFVIQLYSGHCSMFNVCLHVIEELKINKTIYTSAAAPNSRIHCGVHRRRCGCCLFCFSVFFCSVV